MTYNVVAGRLLIKQLSRMQAGFVLGPESVRLSLLPKPKTRFLSAPWMRAHPKEGCRVLPASRQNPVECAVRRRPRQPQRPVQPIHKNRDASTAWSLRSCSGVRSMVIAITPQVRFRPNSIPRGRGFFAAEFFPVIRSMMARASAITASCEMPGRGSSIASCTFARNQASCSSFFISRRSARPTQSP